MHTPTPWKVDAYGQVLTDPISGAYETICTTPKAFIDNKLATFDHKQEATDMLLAWSQRASDNAVFIVKAVNSYEAMRAALEQTQRVLQTFNYDFVKEQFYKNAEVLKAITLAEGKE
jgi:hypothetical protein